MNEYSPFDEKQTEYIQKCQTSWLNVAEGGKRGGKERSAHGAGGPCLWPGRCQQVDRHLRRSGAGGALLRRFVAAGKAEAAPPQTGGGHRPLRRRGLFRGAAPRYLFRQLYPVLLAGGRLLPRRVVAVPGEHVPLPQRTGGHPSL